MTATPADAETAVYARRGATELALDIFRPHTESRNCAILVFHGGGWRFGSKEHTHARARVLAAQGFTAIAVQYRLLDVAAWPAQLEDAAAACTWVRDHADALDIDPAMLVVQGHSAGAQIALMTGTLGADVRPAAIIAYYPPIGFYPASPPAPPSDPDAPPLRLPLDLDELGQAPSWMLFPPGTSRDDLAAASPISLLHEAFPPAILFHATADQLFDIRSSIAMHQRLIELDVSTELHIYADRDHEFDMAPSMTQATVAATTSFLKRVVTHREENEAEARRFSFPPVEQP
jgi:acetyl esterase/lipase